MKKILVFLTLVIVSVFLSCDSDNNPADTKIIALKTIIDGVPLDFDTAKVEKQYIVPTNGGTPYTDLKVTLTISNDKTKKIIIQLADQQTGTESCYYFVYTGDLDPSDPDDIGTDYQYVRRFDRDKFSIDITENTPNTLKGTFSGTLLNYKLESILIPDGSFDIKY